MVNLDHKLLKDEMTRILEEKDVCEASRHHCVESLIQTSLRGVDSHGINLFPHYCRAIDSGRISKNPQFKIDHPSDSIILLDADDAFGHHAGAAAMEEAVDKAKKTGMAAASVRSSTHFGAAAYFGLMAAENDCIGFAFTNADALTKAFHAKEAFFGTNPICFTAPLENEEPLCLDMATSLISWNKIKNYRRIDEKIPDHWAYDKTGLPVTDPHKSASLSPIGDYKGFGLGMMVDVLCALLADGFISKDLMAMYDSPIEARRKVTHFFMALDISKFLNIDAFKQKLQEMVDRIRNLEQLDETNKVMVPGDPEKITLVKRKENGIPMDEIMFEQFIKVSANFRTTVIE